MLPVGGEKVNVKKKNQARATPKTAAKAGRRPSVKRSSHLRFPIVGIGTSAGGLEALENFLLRVPKNPGMAFVIVQHLDPTRKGIMPELLQRATGMKVIQVKDRMKVEKDRVYVIPPNKDMSILHRALHLLPPASPRGLRLPIDFFLRSLAHDQQEQSIGVILSGMGSDGTLGVRAIKEKGGVVLVQDPITAKFDGMPRSAIDAGLADIVAPVQDLPDRIVGYLKRTPLGRNLERVLEAKAHGAVEKAIILLRTHTGHDFSLYKKNSFFRRIERRMGIHQIHKLADYVRYLQENSQELDLLFKELLIGVTSFFRDPDAWEELRRKILPALIAKRPAGHILRVWVPGCSTGEEAYSMAMVFKEVIDKIKPKKKITLQVFATDLDKDAIGKARLGVYPENICADVAPKQMSRFFTKTESGCRVKPEIREMVIFAEQSLIQDPPFTKLDILSCRNLLIYLAPEMQKKLIPLFHYSLSPGGILFLGSAETIGTFSDLFAPLNNKWRIFQRTTAALRADSIQFPTSFASPMRDDTKLRAAPKPHVSLQSVADQFVLEHFASPTVLADTDGNILYISGRTGKYLEPAAGKANWNIFAMARDGLRDDLTNAFHKAVDQKTAVIIRGLHVATSSGPQFVDISVHRLSEPEAMRGLVMIVFTDVHAPLEPASNGRGSKDKNPTRALRMNELGRKYHRARLEAQAVREEMQTSQEELRSTNEEQQSTNEELQSANEELTTSKEEMQSLNEELQTVNAELQSKVDELSRTSNDMKNLLNSTDIATLFLDLSLHVRRFTTQATKIIKLIPSDVGRAITDLASDLLYPELVSDSRHVLRTLGFIEKAVSTVDGRWFNVRIMPYRTNEDRVDGVVITFADITMAKHLEIKLRQQQAALEKLIVERAAKSGDGDDKRAIAIVVAPKKTKHTFKSLRT
ncbi:MAG: cheBR [Spartobacteria bacterium]|nr:cheBR [Spartobacteria bacterium]